MINFFSYCLKKMIFSSLPRGTPHDRRRRTDKKHIFTMNANKINEYVHRGPIFFVCSSERNLVSSIHKGVYGIRSSLWGVATLDI